MQEMKQIKEIIDVYGRKLNVDYGTRVMIRFNNKTKN